MIIHFGHTSLAVLAIEYLRDGGSPNGYAVPAAPDAVWYESTLMALEQSGLMKNGRVNEKGAKVLQNIIDAEYVA